MQKNAIVRSTVSIGIVCFSLLQLICVTACTAPQLIHDVQMAEPLVKVPGEKKWDVTFSGGLTTASILWLPVTLPNGELNTLIRYGSRLNREIQIPLNVSTALFQYENPFQNEKVFNFNTLTGLFVKNSDLIHGGDDTVKKFDESYYRRSLYSSTVNGITLGSLNLITKNEEKLGYEILPFIGFYFKRMKEMARPKSIGIKGFFLNGKLYGNPLGKSPIGDRFVGDFFVNGFIGREYQKYIYQFTYGAGYQYVLGPRIYLGITIASK